jgi:VCBS repeat protein/ASPIC/UnbV protein/PPIC-type peptidyl-prolyl cis-trans isomerase-like protein
MPVAAFGLRSLSRLIFPLVAAFLACAVAWPRAAQKETDEVTLRIIVVGSRDEAEEIVRRLKEGENFVALAAQYSLDSTADRGGLLGHVSTSSLRLELRQALRDVGVGQLTGIVQVPTGFAVLRVVPDGEASGVGTTVVNQALAATGSVKYVIEVAGYTVATTLLQQAEKPPDWNQDPQTICRVRRQSLDAGEKSIVQNITAAAIPGADTSPVDLAHSHFLIAQLQAYDGRMEQAIEAFTQARRLAVAHDPDAVPPYDEALGIAHLHQAGLENNLHRAPGDRCLLSVARRPPLARSDHIKHAIDQFTTYLRNHPGDLEVRWLLNVAHMTAGSYPAGVPPAQLIGPRAFDSGEDVGRFVDVAAPAGLNFVGSAGAAVVDDFDNDGVLDVVTTSLNSCEPMRLFRRTQTGRFSEESDRAGLGKQLGGLNAVQTDYNNDGHVDLLVLRGGWEMAQRKSLLRNNGDGTFTDVTVASGLARPATSTQTAVWTDFNRDGLLDLFVGNENSPAQLFRNKGDGTFEDVAASARVNRTAYSKGVTAGDYDNDGWPDLYVSNLGGGNFLYRNNRDGTFSELAAAAGVPGPGRGFATWFFDYDNDGWQDLFVASYYTSVEETARSYLKLPTNADTMKLYRNLRDGSFQDVTRALGLDKPFMPMGANYGDIDNDGFLDIYLGTGNPSYAALVPSVLLHNRGGSGFSDVTVSSGTGEFHKGHGVAFADLDHDGDEDIVFEVGGATPGDAHALRLFENPGHRRDWITLQLVGVKSNRAAIGARITVTVEEATGARRAIPRVVGSGGSFGASPLQQHIGLGSSVRRVDIEVWWPTSGTRQRFTGVGTNQFIRISEFGSDYVRLDRPRTPLGGSHTNGLARAR